MQNNKKPRGSQIDLEIMKIVFGNDKTAMKKYINNFISTTSELVKDAVSVIKAKDQTHALKCMHLIKGPVGSSGFIVIYKLCEQVEEQVTLNHWLEATQLCEDIQTQLNKLQLEVTKKYG